MVIMDSIVLEMREVIAIGRQFVGSDLFPFWGILLLLLFTLF